MVVLKTLGVGAGAGSVAELDLGEFLGGGDEVRLMAEGVCKHYVAACVGELLSCLLALLGLGYIGLENVLIFAQAELLARGLGGVHEVEVIGGVLIMQENKTDLQIGSGSCVGSGSLGCGSVSRGGFGCSGCCGLTACAQCKYHNERQEHCDDLFHSSNSPL